MVSAGPGWVGQGSDRDTASASREHPHLGASLSPRPLYRLAKHRLKWSVGQAGPLQGLNWAPAQRVLFPGDPKPLPAQQGSSKSKPQGFCLENLTRKTQNPVQEGDAAAKGGEQQALAL